MLILLTLLVICVALVIGIPVPFAFGLALVYMYLTGDHDPAGFLTSGHWRMNVLVLLAIPLFIMAGTIMERGKIAQPLVELAELFVGRFKGGIAYAAVGASAVFGSIAGSATATLTCIGSIMMPQLRRANYPEGLSAALITNAAPLGPADSAECDPDYLRVGDPSVCTEVFPRDYCAGSDPGDAAVHRELHHVAQVQQH